MKIDADVTVRVYTQIRKTPTTPWRSVVLLIPLSFYEPRSATTMRGMVRALAKKHGVDKKRTMVVDRTGGIHRSCYGYVRIYRGPGTKRERALFKRVFLAATRLKVNTVLAAVPEDEEERYATWER